MEEAYKQQNRLTILDFNFEEELSGYMHGSQELGRIARINGEYFMNVNQEFANSLVYEKYHALPSEKQLCSDQVQSYESGGTQVEIIDSEAQKTDTIESPQSQQRGETVTYTSAASSPARPLTGFGHVGAQAGASSSASSFSGLLSRL